MTTDFRIDIAANGAALRLSLFAKVPGIPDAGKHFDRQPLILASATVDKLRRGEASHLEVQQISGEVSQWLFANDISPYLDTALNQPGDEQVRVILSIIDEQLRQSLSDAPFELSVLQGSGIPLALHTKNAAIFHLLPKVGSSPLSPGAGSWPLRVLIVRSNPIDLGGAIPAAATVRDNIFQILDSNGLDRSLVQVQVLSREAGTDIVGQPTRDGFLNQIKKAPYDILVYLGHGDVLPVYPGLPPVNVLQLESDDGATHITIPADQLAVLLHERPVPVVLLIGCLTAGNVPADQKAGLDSFIPQWMRGVQGLAQALVNSESRVQIAVGTRYMLETVDAMLFLKAFFTSLLKTKPGNVEAAVHAARSDLHFSNPPGSYSWSAPMIFRNLDSEPVFPFLASPPANICPTSDAQQNLRSIFWDTLSKTAWGLRQQSTASLTVLGMLSNAEEQYKQHILQTAPCLIMPKCVEAHSDNSVTFPVELYGALNVEELRGTLVVGGSNVQLTDLKATPELLASGYEVLSATQDNQATFSIERTAPAGALQAGPVLMATVQLDSATQVVYPTNVNIRRTTPQQAVCTGTNALIVPAP